MADHASSQPSASEETSVDDGSKSSSNVLLENSDKKTQDDSDLNELLDSALEDFDKMKVAEVTSGASSLTPHGASEGKAEGSDSDPSSADFSEVFSEHFAAHFEETMASLMSQNPQVMQQFEKLAEAAETAGDSQEAQQTFMETLTQTLVDMTQNAEGLQQESVESEAVGAGQGQGEDFMPMMQELMQTLLSKNVLYPSLKDISGKYPAYLAANEGKLSSSEVHQYRKQYDLMTAICQLYEEEQVGDTPNTRTQRFEKLLDLMQQMQELGQPPKDIVGEMAPGLEFDENGIPKLPGMGSQCSLM